MKASKFFYLFLLTSLLSLSTLLYSQEQTVTISANSEDISYGLDLKIVAQLFAKSKTTEEFEIVLNQPDSSFNNLDINGDGQVDYIRVIEAGEGNNRLIVLQAVLSKDIYQDVASIYIEKDETQEVSVQVIGDEYIYGTNYIIEPIYIYRPLIYDWLWSGRWYSWYSPWYWGYYPRWWRYHTCLSHSWYRDRCYRFHRHHHDCSYRHSHHPHQGYTHHSGHVARNDYAVRHPDNSFSRRNSGMNNARDLNKRTHSRGDVKNGRLDNRSQQGSVRQDNNVRSNRIGGFNRTSTQQRSTYSGSRAHQSNNSSNYTRTSSSTHRKPNNGQRTNNSSYNGGSHYRGSGHTSTSHSSGSVSRGGGSSRSGGGHHSGGGSRRR